jgi:hypothetical protein
VVGADANGAVQFLGLQDQRGEQLFDRRDVRIVLLLYIVDKS